MGSPKISLGRRELRRILLLNLKVLGRSFLLDMDVLRAFGKAVNLLLDDQESGEDFLVGGIGEDWGPPEDFLLELHELGRTF